MKTLSQDVSLNKIIKVSRDISRDIKDASMAVPAEGCDCFAMACKQVSRCLILHAGMLSPPPWRPACGRICWNLAQRYYMQSAL
jgi:hypothetical protein